jgi:hypothetical protein
MLLHVISSLGRSQCLSWSFLRERSKIFPNMPYWIIGCHFNLGVIMFFLWPSPWNYCMSTSSIRRGLGFSPTCPRELPDMF